ncbi:hypothetical protein TBR22_A41660 [Luteitalea sp. TBR-22]|uniref:tetratricopeptide repeat protein n=1 Tax=Luteitalea sp. TBR-22 TaxID=2802971 RepID=UPI001AFBF3B7|nr:tetratricopeptide repeat protein [Luteitalea sp. TBR-22]BCS34940.1 hypothetical protein TBR22_A41660 [Luteitalea sp. TBR-22]
MPVMPAIGLMALLALAQPADELTRLRQQAATFMADGSPARAVPLLERAVAARPDAADLRMELAEALYSAGAAAAASGDKAGAIRHWQAAEGHFKQVALLSPGMKELVDMRLLLLYDGDRLARPRDAEPLLRAQIAREPSMALYHVMLARALKDQQRLGACANVLAAAGKQVADADGMLLAMTTADLVAQTPIFGRADQRRLLEMVAALADKEIALNGDRKRDALQAKAGAYLLLAERVATTDAERAAYKQKGDAAFDEFHALAPARTGDGDPATASAAAREARLTAIMTLGDALRGHLAAGRTTEATALVDQGTRIYGANTEFWLAVSGAYHAAGDIDRAIGVLVKAVGLEPRNPERHHALATAHFDAATRNKALPPADQARHLTESLKAVDAALALDDAYMEAHVYRALVLKAQSTRETDPARKKALQSQADAAMARAQAIRAARTRGAD